MSKISARMSNIILICSGGCRLPQNSFAEDNILLSCLGFFLSVGKKAIKRLSPEEFRLLALTKEHGRHGWARGWEGT